MQSFLNSASDPRLPVELGQDAAGGDDEPAREGHGAHGLRRHDGQGAWRQERRLASRGPVAIPGKRTRPFPVDMTSNGNK